MKKSQLKHLIKEEISHQVFIFEQSQQVIGAGILCYCLKTKKYLVVKRAEGSPEPNTWCSVGGKAEKEDKTFKDNALREFEEEVGYSGPFKSLKRIYTYRKPELKFVNFLGTVDNEFTPDLDIEENTEYKWLTKEELTSLPNKHFGLEILLNYI